MECAICHKKESSKTRCINGHYVCNDCHTQGMDNSSLACAWRRLHRPRPYPPPDDGPVLLPYARARAPCDGGAALLTAYKCRGQVGPGERSGDVQLGGKAITGGALVASGQPAGGGISAGAVRSHRHGIHAWPGSPGLSSQMTARALDSIGKVGGPRCCKRDSWLAVQAAVDFVREHLGVEMQHSVPVCSYSARNSQCMGKRCPFSAAKQRAPEAKTAPSF